MEVLIGVLTAATLILLGVCAIVLALSRRKKHQTSVISTSIFKKPFGGVSINVKDIFMNLTPHNNNNNIVVGGGNQPVCGGVGGGNHRHITENPLPIGEQMRSDSFASDAYDKSQHNVVYETPLLARKDYETIRSVCKGTYGQRHYFTKVVTGGDRNSTCT